MIFGSVCSGIEAASVAWNPLGFHASFVSEIAPFPCAVLAHHYPNTPNLGDMNHHHDWNTDRIDLLVGGTPCQSFSNAGLRRGLADPRGNLTLVFLSILQRTAPRWCVWENVPGVLSDDSGRTFGTFLGGLGQLGYGFAFRVLDAQHFGVPQRRRRVFVVAHSGARWERAAAVLFDSPSVPWDPPKGEEEAEDLARSASRRSEGAGCESGTVPACDVFPRVSGTIATTYGGKNYSNVQEVIAGSIIAFPEFMSSTQRATAVDVAPAIQSHNRTAFAGAGRVRRFTPRECERLQGFPDDYTALLKPNGKPVPDDARYAALGNSIAVPVLRWIGERIKLIDSMP